MSRLIGITGGIATGKSTVTQMLRELGAKVIDADELAREVVQPGAPALAEIAARWPDVVKDGALDRKRLGERVFGSDADRKALEQITHPRIQQLALEKSLQLWEAGETVAFYDAALLIENRLHELMNGVVLVVAPPEVQLARLMKRNGFSEAEARARIASQMPLVEKKKHATWVIDNGGTIEATRAQVQKLWHEVKP